MLFRKPTKYILCLISLQKFGVGVQVRVDSDEQKSISLQQDFGGWNSKMKEVIVSPCISVCVKCITISGHLGRDSSNSA